MPQAIELGISTCPNDTFAFHALLNRDVDRRGLEFRTQLMDVEELNQGVLNGRFDVAKTSFHAALLVTDRYLVLPSGSALGFGVGPLLLSRHVDRTPTDFLQPPDVLCPGSLTTATLLYRLMYPGTGRIRQTLFSEIMPALRAGQADFGVCIHEGRFTWQDQGLVCTADLGHLWEQQTGGPLPLGGILGRRDLGHDVLWRVQQVIADSLEFALADPGKALGTMARYAQELDHRVLMSHVDVYVNDQTRLLGDTGRQALDTLWELAVRAGIVDAAGAPLEVLAESLPSD